MGKSAKIGPWGIYREKDRNGPIVVIKRKIRAADGRILFERRPRDEYRLFLFDNDQLSKYIIRLNGRDLAEEQAKELWQISNAFIDSQMLKEFYLSLKLQTSDEVEALKLFRYFRKYFINFFHKFSEDPLIWHKNQEKWAMALLNTDDCPEDYRLFSKGTLKSTRVLKTIISTANKFMKFLHKKRPETTKELVFAPLSTANYRWIRAERERREEVTERHYVPANDFETLKADAPKELIPLMNLAMYYGLRSSETLGLYEKQETAIMEGFLRLTEQAGSFNRKEKILSFRILKGRAARSIPHWFCSPADAWEWIGSITPMGRTTVWKKWGKYIREMIEKGKIKTLYTFHDFRHSWVTNAIRKYPATDVQKAAGHKNIMTTMEYLKDDRGLIAKPWRPS
jgi:integrase